MGKISESYKSMWEPPKIRDHTRHRGQTPADTFFFALRLPSPKRAKVVLGDAPKNAGPETLGRVRTSQTPMKHAFAEREHTARPGSPCLWCSPVVNPGPEIIMERSELVGLFKKTAEEIAEKQFGELNEESVIANMGVDSLAMLEVIGEMERELKIQIPDDQLVGIETIKQLLDVVEKRITLANS